MMFSRKIRHFAALAAALGIALQALWPIIAQARPGRSISVPVFSAEGTRHSIELPLGKNQTEKSAEHCKLCVLGTDKPAVLNSEQVFLSSEAGSECFQEDKKIQVKFFEVSAALPRAPPQAS
jgi:hypothetical protein